MKIDVSEVKSFRGCKRSWKLSSRNQMHLAPLATPPQFSLGTLFHEALHSLYLGVSLDKVMATVRKEMDPTNDAALLAMIPGYARVVLPGDLDRFTVLDIEHKFNFKGPADVDIVGSIDMIVVDDATNQVWGFEHKTAKAFRDATFLWMDEQPRLYTHALELYVDQLNDYRYKQWREACDALDELSDGDVQEVEDSGGKLVYPPEPKMYTLGGIYINEVKKLLRDFQYQRTPCQYPADDMVNFMRLFYDSVEEIVATVGDGTDPCCPNPSYFQCQMCTFKTICSTYMYATLNTEQILKEFAEEFKVRDTDHLDEKVERSND